MKTRKEKRKRYLRVLIRRQTLEIRQRRLAVNSALEWMSHLKQLLKEAA